MTSGDMRADTAVALFPRVAYSTERLEALWEAVRHEPSPVAQAAFVAERSFVGGSAVVDVVQVVELGVLVGEAASRAGATKMIPTGVVDKDFASRPSMPFTRRAVDDVLAPAASVLPGSIGLLPALRTSLVNDQPTTSLPESLRVCEPAKATSIVGPSLPCLADPAPLLRAALGRPGLRHRYDVVCELHKTSREVRECRLPGDREGVNA